MATLKQFILKKRPQVVVVSSIGGMFYAGFLGRILIKVGRKH